VPPMSIPIRHAMLPDSSGMFSRGRPCAAGSGRPHRKIAELASGAKP
jgi:hypothetical protein